ncbi:MAG: type III polyketide synthase [Actinomycetes bacterium]
MPVIASAATSLPEHRYAQGEITEAFADLIIHEAGASPQTRDVIRRTHEATTVEARHLVLTLPEYEPLDNFGKANDVFLREAPPLAAQAVQDALDRAGLRPEDVDVIASTTVTGVAVPSIDARLVPILGLRSDVRRLPLMGLGCVAGASGLARVSEVLAGDPDAVAVLVSVELCSLTLQHDDVSMANIVASGLFGDGAAAVVLVGDRRADDLGLKGPKVLGSHAHFFADTERVMGWDVGSSGLRVVLSPEVPALVAAEMADVTNTLLHAHDLRVADVSTWVAHSGGPKVLIALEDALGLEASATELTWRSLREAGNLSSASVLDVLRRTLEINPPASGEPAVVVAMGPGFCAELVLLEW